jgi:hypothetical protein
MEARSVAWRGVAAGVETTFRLAKVIVPVYIIVTLLKHTVLMGALGRLLAPAMRLFGLPGEAATPLVLGNTVNIYAALAAVKALQMTPQQVTIIGLMVVISHSLPSEYAVLRRMGAAAGKVTVARVLASLVAGMLAGAILRG